MQTAEQVIALAEAMWQLLDDMGKDGLCVCAAAKAQARLAYEPFRIGHDMDMTVEQAERVVALANS